MQIFWKQLAISKHLKNIFSSGELIINSVHSILEYTATDNKIYQTSFYNLDAKLIEYDRFLIIDNKDIYHIGASLKDLGKKWFAFSKLHFDINDILNKII